MENKPFITCKYDSAFKEVFLKEENKDLLISLLNTCLPYRIKDVKVMASEMLQGNVRVKRKILDVLLDSDEERINVEVNANMHQYTRDRNLAYICNVHSQNILSGDKYNLQRKTIQINLSYGISNDQKLYRVYRIMDEDSVCYSDKLIIYEFNMDKIMEFWYAKDEEQIDKYKYLIMLDLKPDDLQKLSKKDKKVGKYKMELECVNVTIGINDWISEEKDREMIRNSLLQEGLDEGIKQGIEQGIEQGIKQGIKQNQREMIINLNNLGTPIDVIAKASGLTEDEVKEIIESENK